MNSMNSTFLFSRRLLTLSANRRTLFALVLIILTCGTYTHAAGYLHRDSASTLTYRIHDHLIANDDTIRSSKARVVLSVLDDTHSGLSNVTRNSPFAASSRFVLFEEVDSSRPPHLVYQHTIRFCPAAGVADTSLCLALAHFESSAPLPFPFPWLPLTRGALPSDTLFVHGHSRVLFREGYDALDSSAWSGWIVRSEKINAVDTLVSARVYLGVRSHIRQVTVVGTIDYYHEAEGQYTSRYKQDGLLHDGEVDALLTGFVQVDASGMDPMRFPSVRHLMFRVVPIDNQ